MSQFLNALRADPFDPLPRLVYADWLEENEDPERAELIRLQVRSWTWNPDPAERDPVQVRIRDLTDRVFARILARFADPTAVHLTFDAGLIDIACGEFPQSVEVPEIGVVRMFPPVPSAQADFVPHHDHLAVPWEGLPAQWQRDSTAVSVFGRTLRGAIPADPRVWANSVGIRLVPLPPGTFTMGSGETESGHDVDEVAHPVTLTATNLHIGIWPVTQGQYRELIGTNPSMPSATGGDPDAHPVQSLSHEEAEEFCRILSNRSEERAAGRIYRLPTEAEWEYACRAGTTTRFHFGDEMTPLTANCMHAYRTTLPCGCFPPNAFGVFDMHGQVREWCADWYHRSYYEISPTHDPKGPEMEDNRVMRGGAWDVSSENYCRSGYRVYYGPMGSLSGIGFRVVCTVG